MTTAVRPTIAVEPSRSLLTWWGDRGVRTKTLAAVGVTATVALGVGVMGISALGTTADSTRGLYEGNVGAIQGTSAMVDALNATRLASRNAILAPTPELTEEVLAGLPESEEAFHAGMETYLAAGPTEEQRALLEEVDAAYDAYHGAVAEELVPLALANDYVGWYTANKERVSPPQQGGGGSAQRTHCTGGRRRRTDGG